MTSSQSFPSSNKSILFPFSVYSAVRLFNSSQDQYYLLGQFNTNTFFIPYDEVMEYETIYPNISSTTIPRRETLLVQRLAPRRAVSPLQLLRPAQLAQTTSKTTFGEGFEAPQALCTVGTKR